MELKTDYIYKTSDDELIYMINENSDDAKYELYSKYEKIINLEIKKYINIIYKFGLTIEDIKQEAVLGFYKAINTYDIYKEAKFQTYAELCLKRSIKTYLKKKSKNKVIRDLYLDELNDITGIDHNILLSSDEGEPLKHILVDETLKEVSSNYRIKLTNIEKQVLSLTLDNKSAKEISVITGLPIRKVYYILSKSRKKLQQSI